MSPTEATGSGQPPGIVINVPSGATAHRRLAMLLATLAEPPKGPQSVVWQRRVLAICRAYWALVSDQDPGWRSAPGTFLPEELEVSRETAQKALAVTLNKVNKGHGGAHVLVPYFSRAMKRAEARAAGRAAQLERSPPPVLEREIQRVLWHEAELRPVIEAKFQNKVPPRLPAPDGESAVTNVANRVLRPLRPIWHLLVAYSFVIDQMEKAAATVPEVAASLGFPVDTAPRFTWWHLTQFPEYVDRMIQTAQAFEAAVPFLEIEHASEDELVRLRLG